MTVTTIALALLLVANMTPGVLAASESDLAACKDNEDFITIFAGSANSGDPAHTATVPATPSTSGNSLLQVKQKATYNTIVVSEDEVPQDEQKGARVCFWSDTNDAYIQSFCEKLPGNSICKERTENVEMKGESLPCVAIRATDSELGAVMQMQELAGRPGATGVRGVPGSNGASGAR